MKKILVTGGTGYIGSHTAVALMEKGYQVIIADNLYNSNERVLDAIEAITGVRPLFENVDLADETACMQLFHRHADIAAVIHFAAYKSVNESVAKPLDYYRNNLDSLMWVLRGMAAVGCRKIVFSSSCTVYGQPETLPVTETMPYQDATCPYGNTKRIAEEMLKDVVRADGVQNGGQPSLKVLLLR